MSPPAARCATTNVGWDFPRPGDSDRRHVARSQDAFLCLRTRMQKSTSSWVVSRAAKSVGRAASTVARVVPFSQLAVAASRAVPYSAAVCAVWGGVAAGLEGKNIISGAVRAALPSALGKFAYDAGRSVLRGENLAQAVKKAANVGISEAREQLRFVQMVAPFIPGVGSGVAAALGAANALSEGKPITEALVAAARGALPGGAIAQTGFDVAINLARGKNLTAAALTAARNAHPGGPLARAAFDTAVALGEGKRLQDAAISAASGDLPGGPAARLGFDVAVGLARGEKPTEAMLSAARARLPGPAARAAFDATVAVANGKPVLQAAQSAASRALTGGAAKAGLDRIQAAAASAAARVLSASPYAGDPLAFARLAARGQNIQTAALSRAGRQVLARVAR